MAETTLYDAGDIVDKYLIAKVNVPYYSGVPGHGTYSQLGTFPAGSTVGQVYSYFEANPAVGRNTLWWMFYPGGVGRYYYVPHQANSFDVGALTDQGVVSEAAKIKEPETWYEKVLSQALPVIAIAIIGAAAVRGYLSRK